MDFLEQAKTLYRKRHQHAGALSTNDHTNLSLSITKLVRSSLTQQGGVSIFKYLPFIAVIQRTVASNCFQGDQAAMAFTQLEKYLLLLLGQPWKREFWLLKTYGGFFRAKVKAHLDGPEEILQLVGYMREGESIASSGLILERPPNAEVVLNVAFDCHVAAELCIYIGEYYDKMKVVGLSLRDAMNVLLSGTSTDPVPPFPMAAVQGRSNNNNMEMLLSDLVKQKGASRDPAQMVGPTGRGVGAGINSVRQVTAGVPTSHPAACLTQVASGLYPVPQPVLYPSSHAVDHPAVMLKADMQQMHTQGGVGDAGFRQVPGSRPAFPSAASTQSSGYGSGSASVLSNPSSAYVGASSPFSASSGYSSSSHRYAAPVYNYSYSGQAPSGGDQVDSLPLTVQLPPPSHSRQLSLPQRSPADFPFIDDDCASPGPMFPTATHEQHLQEGFRNVPGGPGRGRGGPGESEVVRPQGVGAREGLVSSAADVRRLPRVENVAGHGALAGAGGGVVADPPSSMVHRPGQLSSEMTRFPSSQPATAVTAMLNASSPLDGHHPKLSGVDYLPHSAVVGMSENSAKSIPGNLHNTSAPPLSRESQTQPARYPPSSSPLPFQHYSNQVSAAVSQGQKPPTFAQMAAAGKPATNSQGLISRQAQQPSPSAVLGSQDKSQIAKSIISSGRSGSGSSSEVILREKIGVKGGPTRGSSLVTPARAVSAREEGFSRQSSQSMDLGMLKWRCKTCTMENSAVETICSACSKSRNAPDLQFPAAGESKRMCSACTYENLPGCSVCEMCSTALTDVHTYV